MRVILHLRRFARYPVTREESMLIVYSQIHTGELPWLKGRDLERVMGGAFVDWLGWSSPAAA